MHLPDRLTLKQRVLTAGMWSLGGHGLSQAIRFGSNLLMTRLLVPDMFGIIAIAMLVIVGLAMLSDLGIKQSVIQSSRGGDPAFLNTAWVIQIYRGAGLCTVALAVALILLLMNRAGMVPERSVYADPILPYVISVLSVVTLIGGFQSTKFFEATRNILLGPVTRIELAAQVVGLVCTVLWAVIDRSIWCLIFGQICALIAGTVMSHTWLPGSRNRWQWDPAAAHEIIHFGKWIVASSILGFLVNNGDRLLLGALLSPTTLGVYVIAFSIFSSIDQVVTKIVGDLAYPALSEISRQGPDRLKPSYYRFFVMISAFSYSCAGILIVSGQSIIDLLYDTRYQQAGWILQILAVAIVTMPFRLTAVSLLALGLSRSFFMISVLRLLILFLITPIAFHFFGLSGALGSIVASYLSTVPISIAYSVKYRFFDLRKELLMLVTLGAGMILGEGIRIAASHL